MGMGENTDPISRVRRTTSYYITQAIILKIAAHKRAKVCNFPSSSRVHFRFVVDGDPELGNNKSYAAIFSVISRAAGYWSKTVSGT